MNGGLLVFLILLLIGLLVVTIVAWCKIFRKAGIHPGKLFIPMYGQYLQYDIADSKGIFFATIALSGIFSIVSSIISSSAVSRSYNYYSYNSYSSSLSQSLASLGVVSIIFMVIAFILQCVFCTRLARNFGKSGGFAVGLIFLPFIFICILGFGDAEYCGGNYGYKGSSAEPDWTCSQCHAVNPAYKGVCSICGAQKKQYQ